MKWIVLNSCHIPHIYTCSLVALSKHMISRSWVSSPPPIIYNRKIQLKTQYHLLNTPWDLCQKWFLTVIIQTTSFCYSISRVCWMQNSRCTYQPYSPSAPSLEGTQKSVDLHEHISGLPPGIRTRLPWMDLTL